MDSDLGSCTEESLSVSIGSCSTSNEVYNPDNHLSPQDVEDLKDIVLSTVAEELASMVACSGDQLENIARNHNAGMEEKEMSYVFIIILLLLINNSYQVVLLEAVSPSGKIK